MWLIPPRKREMWRHRHHYCKERWTLWEEALIRLHSLAVKHSSFDWPSTVSLGNGVEKQPIIHGSVQIRRLDPSQNRYQVLSHWRIRLCPALLHWKWYVQPFDETLREESWPSAFRSWSCCEERREDWSDLGEHYSVLPNRRGYLQVHGVGLSYSRRKISLNKARNDYILCLCINIMRSLESLKKH